jgi:Tfp pilus assembly protein PilV
MRPFAERTKRGLSLVETVVMAGVVSLIVIFLVGLIPSFKMSNRRASMQLQAGGLAQSYLDQLRVGAFDDVATATFADVTVDGVTYRAVVSQSEVVIGGNPPSEISKKVRVVVSWTWRDRDFSTFRETIFCRILRS